MWTASIATDGYSWSDALLLQRARPGTTIGMSTIKRRRLTNRVKCRPGLNVGDCVPFHFSPRSVMLYLIHMTNHPELDYHGGQDPIVHLEADLHETVDWAERYGRRWAFTLSNAGSGYFKDRCHLARPKELDWPAIQARDWRTCKEGKQAEFLIEQSFPWILVRRIGARTLHVRSHAQDAVQKAVYQPDVELNRDWYY